MMSLRPGMGGRLLNPPSELGRGAQFPHGRRRSFISSVLALCVLKRIFEAKPSSATIGMITQYCTWPIHSRMSAEAMN